MSNRPLTSFLAAFLAVSSLASAQQAGDCGIAAQNAFVRDTMNDIYFWYREMPEVDPAAYPSPDALLEVLRYRPLDTFFSYVGMRAAEDAYYSDSQFIGFGFSMKLVGPDDLRVAGGRGGDGPRPVAAPAAAGSPAPSGRLAAARRGLLKAP